MSDINTIIGKNLTKLRKHAKLTQAELAEHFNYTDKSVSKWEKGESLPSIEVLYSLAEFYGVTLDDLTSEEEIIPHKTTNTKGKKMFPTRLVITLLAVCSVWVLATILYVVFKITMLRNEYIYFLWAVPVSCIIIIIFNAIWGKAKYLFPILSVLIWTVITAFYVQFIKFNLWPLFILGIPLQIVVIVCSALILPKRKIRTVNCPTQPIETKQNKKLKQSIVEAQPTIKNNKSNDVEPTSTTPQQENEPESNQPPKSEGKIQVTLPQIRTLKKDDENK